MPRDKRERICPVHQVHMVDGACNSCIEEERRDRDTVKKGTIESDLYVQFPFPHIVKVTNKIKGI